MNGSIGMISGGNDNMLISNEPMNDPPTQKKSHSNFDESYLRPTSVNES